MVNYRNRIVQDDLKQLSAADVPWKSLEGKTILITGATGMIASYCSFLLLYLKRHARLNIHIVLLARNPQKLKAVFGAQLAKVDILVQDVCTPISFSDTVDYIIHAAGGASPQAILNDPIGVIKANDEGMHRVLEFAQKSRSKKILFTSTREVYGKVAGKDSITEDDMGILDPLASRSCYPESKRLGETLLRAYAEQHGLIFNTLRIAHAYGPGMPIKNDGRVLADFINDTLEGRDILLNSEGQADRAFCYITDTVEAVFRVLLSGKANQAYNIANETAPLKILDLARLLLRIAGTGKKAVPAGKVGLKGGYTNYKRVGLDTQKIESLGWQPRVSLEKGLQKTLRAYQVQPEN